MADQCIICLDSLDHISAETDSKSPEIGLESAKVAPTISSKDPSNDHNGELIAVVQTCGHILHDHCLQEWTKKANSCPICRSAFHLVEVHNKVGGKSHNPITT